MPKFIITAEYQEKYLSPKFQAPLPGVNKLRHEYKEKYGIEIADGKRIYSINVKEFIQIANAFEKLKDDSSDPLTKKAYQEFIKETCEQAELILKTGLKVELSKVHQVDDHYKGVDDLFNDLRKHKHMWVTNTLAAFGDTAVHKKMLEEHPLLQKSDFKDVNGVTMLYNDVFRFVHDYFGHGCRGSDFSVVGEENTWDAHMRLYRSQLARRAMTTETRGQNAWMNFGKQMRKEDGTFYPPIEKIHGGHLEFPHQKVGLLPEWMSELPERYQKSGMNIDELFKRLENEKAI